ncbi:hypothetical protein T11_301 [Trichinella zimbabwensis]|uniref:Uncharacterized protein n=1 Tax=Trichinella zimbabwensis TaxID=268475 RepID=A0A0V1I4W5_9BILA|nr:hypothetical protein T11_301 [Trichinella zimbabwensis]
MPSSATDYHQNQETKARKLKTSVIKPQIPSKSKSKDVENQRETAAIHTGAQIKNSYDMKLNTSYTFMLKSKFSEIQVMHHTNKQGNQPQQESTFKNKID